MKKSIFKSLLASSLVFSIGGVGISSTSAQSLNVNQSNEVIDNQSNMVDDSIPIDSESFSSDSNDSTGIKPASEEITQEEILASQPVESEMAFNETATQSGIKDIGNEWEDKSYSKTMWSSPAWYANNLLGSIYQYTSTSDIPVSRMQGQ